MTRKDVEDHIRNEVEQPTEIDAEDLKPPVCTWCGDEFDPDSEIVVWDIPEEQNTEVVWRYRYCSDNCKKSDQNAIVDGGEMHPYGTPERLRKGENDD